MNIVVHIVAKDGRRIWPWIALQMVAMMAHYAFFEWMQARGAGDRFVSTGVGSISSLDEYVSYVLFGLEWFAWLVASAVLVQEDPAASDRAFWRSRPVSRGRLMAAKALGLVCFGVVLPMLPKVLWWLHNDFALSDFRTALLSYLAIRAWVLFVVWAIAVSTSGMGGFITGLLVAALAAIALLLLSLNAASPVGHEEGERLGETRMILSLWLAVAGAAAAVVARYASQKRAYLLSTLATTVLALAAVGRFWPTPMALTSAFLFQEPGSAQRVQARIVAIEPNANGTAFIRVQLSGVPNDCEVRGRVRDCRWTIESADGSSNSEEPVRFVYVSSSQKPLEKKEHPREHWLGRPGLVDDGANRGDRSFTLHVLLPDTSSSKDVSSRVHVDLRFTLEVIRNETAFEDDLIGAKTVTRPPYRTTAAFHSASRGELAAEVLMRSPFHRSEKVRFVGTTWNEHNNETSGPGAPVLRRDDHALHVDFVRLRSARYEFSPHAFTGASPARVAVIHEVSVCEPWPKVTQRDVLKPLELSKP
jgi:hypothetical protein